MMNLNRISSCFCIVCLPLILLVSSATADALLDAVTEVSQDQYTSYHLDIESMGLGLYGGPDYNQGYRNRDGWAEGGSLGNAETRLYLADQFAAMGLEVSEQGIYSNIVAELPGFRTSKNIYIVCGHFDTTSGGEKPGGDDNASGTAGVLEAARVLRLYSLDSTLRFIGFNAEEDGMRGSQDYVNTVVLRNDENIMGVINFDMILRPGWDANPDEPRDLDLVTLDRPGCFAWANAFMDAAAMYVPELLFDERNPNASHYTGASDHGPFINAGYPALLAIENTAPDIWAGSNTYYHTPQDASDALANDPASPSGVTYDYGFATDVVKATVATIALEAGLIAFDFNGDGVVDAQDVSLMLDHWHTDEPRYDIAPPPAGDGVVDVQDLIALSEHLFEDYRIVAHWALDEVEGIIAHDSVGENHAEVMGSAVWQPTGGVVDGALLREGIDDLIGTEYVRDPSEGPLSVFAWVKGGAPGQVLISQVLGANWLLADPVEGNLMTELQGFGRSAGPLSSQTVVTDGDWHRIGFVWDGSNRTLYVDNVAVAEDTQNGLKSSDNGLHIGTGKSMEPGSFWSGLIDDVRIYNRAVRP
jgi:hypothetical protein